MSRKSDKEDEHESERQPIPFDDALRVLVNTPPKPKKKPEEKAEDEGC